MPMINCRPYCVRHVKPEGPSNATDMRNLAHVGMIRATWSDYGLDEIGQTQEWCKRSSSVAASDLKCETRLLDSDAP